MSANAKHSAAERAYAILRRQIVSLELFPADSLNRNRLCEQLGVSLTPLRDVLLRLEAEGLVAIFPQSGTKVSRIDPQRILETHFLSASLSTEVVSRLARMPNEAVLSKARALLGAPDRPDETETSLMRTFFAGVGMAALCELIETRSGDLARCRNLAGADAPDGETICRTLGEVIDRIAAADGEGAALAMRAHLSDRIASLSELQKTHPEAFVDQSGPV